MADGLRVWSEAPPEDTLVAVQDVHATQWRGHHLACRDHRLLNHIHMQRSHSVTLLLEHGQ